MNDLISVRCCFSNSAYKTVDVRLPAVPREGEFVEFKAANLIPSGEGMPVDNNSASFEVTLIRYSAFQIEEVVPKCGPIKYSPRVTIWLQQRVK